MAEMTSGKPYLLRAIHEWISDNGLTPQILVDADAQGAELPAGYAKDGIIVLNLGASAVRGLSIGNDSVTFSARFGGRPFAVRVPVEAVLAVHARENGVGMAFGESDSPDRPPPAEDGAERSRRPALRVVK